MEEAEALVDFLEDGAGDLAAAAGSSLASRLPNQAKASATLRRVESEMSSPAILTASGSGAEAGAVAGLARARRLVALELLADPGAFGLGHAAVEVADDALERLLDLVGLAAVDEA